MLCTQNFVPPTSPADSFGAQGYDPLQRSKGPKVQRSKGPKVQRSKGQRRGPKLCFGYKAHVFCLLEGRANFGVQSYGYKRKVTIFTYRFNLLPLLHKVRAISKL